ncbi:hypothetical protein ACHAXT_001197 [Thalassiosira profunda]
MATDWGNKFDDAFGAESGGGGGEAAGPPEGAAAAASSAASVAASDATEIVGNLDDASQKSPAGGGADGGAPAPAGVPSFRCPNCNSSAIESLGPSGSSVCTDCGVIVEENAIVSSVEFVEGAGGTSAMVGQFVGANATRGFVGGAAGRRGGQYGFSRQSRENTLASGRRRIQEVAGLMRLGPHYVDAAHRLFTVAVERNFVQGRRRAHVIAACLYTSCRQEKSQHMLIDFSDALQINVYTLGTCFLKFRRLLGLKLEIIDPALYIYRFAAHLNLDEKANQVAMTALRLVGRMKRDWIVAGRRPAGICAAALLIAARAHGFDRQHHDVTKVLKVCGLTVMSRVKEFGATPSANLTLDEFHEKDDIEAEVDPPIFTQNRIREARAKAVAEGNVELLESGALDDENKKGRWATHWRKAKEPSEKDQQMARMYSELETEMEESAAESKMIAADLKGEDVDALEDGDKKQPAVSFTRAEQIAEHRRPAGISTLHSEIHYPLGKNKRPVVLPNQATPEELAASSQKPEDILNFEEWKAGMPEDASDEVDFLFRSDDEVREREAVFVLANKDYLETQQRKESERLVAEAATRAKQEDELAQEEGRRRYLKTSRSRKRNAADPNELTTEEALMEVVRTRKISRKINYDAMSALFDDTGNFSTELLDDGARKKEEGATAEA